jgi:hypothetical protein
VISFQSQEASVRFVSSSEITDAHYLQIDATSTDFSIYLSNFASVVNAITASNAAAISHSFRASGDFNIAAYTSYIAFQAALSLNAEGAQTIGATCCLDWSQSNDMFQNLMDFSSTIIG